MDRFHNLASRLPEIRGCFPLASLAAPGGAAPVKDLPQRPAIVDAAGLGGGPVEWLESSGGLAAGQVQAPQKHPGAGRVAERLAQTQGLLKAS